MVILGIILADIFSLQLAYFTKRGGGMYGTIKIN